MVSVSVTIIIAGYYIYIKGSRWQLTRIQTADTFCICQTCQVFMNDNYSDSLCSPAGST